MACQVVGVCELPLGGARDKKSDVIWGVFLNGIFPYNKDKYTFWFRSLQHASLMQFFKLLGIGGASNGL